MLFFTSFYYYNNFLLANICVFFCILLYNNLKVNIFVNRVASSFLNEATYRLSDTFLCRQQAKIPEKSAITKSYFSNRISNDLRVEELLTSFNWLINSGIVAKNTLYSQIAAFIPRPIAMCVFPGT